LPVLAGSRSTIAVRRWRAISATIQGLRIHAAGVDIVRCRAIALGDGFDKLPS
jgi:hypothetical protein